MTGAFAAGEILAGGLGPRGMLGHAGLALMNLTRAGFAGVTASNGSQTLDQVRAEEAATRCAGEPPAAFIQKPFAPAALVTTINDAISAA